MDWYGNRRSGSAPIGTSWRHPETAALHAGFRNDPATRAVAVPIYQNTAYELEGDLEKIADVYNAKADGYTYSRIINPTNRALEKRFAAMDDAVDTLSVASGQAATFVTIANLVGPTGGGNIVASSYLYGNTWNLFFNTFKRLGIEARSADPRDPASFARQIDDKTICLFAEVVSNPYLVPCPVGELAALGRRYGVPLVVDNTTTPLVCRPGQMGAALSTYSATKYVCGHGTTLGGFVADHGTFDFAASPDRFPLLDGPDEAHGGIVWREAVRGLGDLAASPYLLKARMTWVRDTGGCMAPFNAFQLIQGIETLALRMERHCENALAVAEMLRKHPKVVGVRYPAFFLGREREIADSIFGPGCGHGAMLTFDVGDAQKGRRVIEAVRLIYHVSNVGDARSLITHPVSTTHTTVPREKRLAAGIADGTIRLCVGIEHVDDIVQDLADALYKT
ncbi:MAG: O-acetylhomoserine aminocarboxypropyltransferase/cysteine synthase [Roseomonas sp.]|nr:O-acetylhomoserine aminocarboxypropyltransferase/cysteine synthase [Roseomonas sp.]